MVNLYLTPARIMTMTVNDNFLWIWYKQQLRTLKWLAGIKFVAECGRYVRNRIWNLCILTGENNCSIEVIEKTLMRAYFLAPSVLFFSLIWLPWHFLHLVAVIGFLAPHLKHILKNNLRCCAICFFVASVIGIYTVLNSKEGSFLPFCSYYFSGIYKAISYFLLLSYNCSCIADGTNKYY